ncbi:MAG: hypothetical protein WBG48_16285 [Pricia sp.]
MFRRYYILFIALLLGLPSPLISQEFKTFTTSDFGLRGNVKSCFVITDYGKEEYYFDTAGRLTKSITRFNDFDYESTYYKYQNNELVERRVENYLDNTFDKATSIATFFQIDTTANRKVTEKIVSYTKQLLEQNVYRYNAEGQLIKMTRTDTDGTDETLIDYDSVDGKRTITHSLNGSPLKVVETWSETSEAGEPVVLESTIKYFDRVPNSKTKEVYNANQKLISQSEFLFDASTEVWIPQEQIEYTYDENGILVETDTQRQNFTTSKSYIYQFDGTENNNWVKQIITPENTYKTRKIKYYIEPKLEED